jgi:hypothetical protein
MLLAFIRLEQKSVGFQTKLKETPSKAGNGRRGRKGSEYL